MVLECYQQKLKCRLIAFKKTSPLFLPLDFFLTIDAVSLMIYITMKPAINEPHATYTNNGTFSHTLTSIVPYEINPFFCPSLLLLLSVSCFMLISISSKTINQFYNDASILNFILHHIKLCSVVSGFLILKFDLIKIFAISLLIHNSLKMAFFSYQNMDIAISAYIIWRQQRHKLKLFYFSKWNTCFIQKNL